MLKLMELEEEGLSFEKTVEKVERFRNSVLTYFVLDNLETLRKNGRLSSVKALVASTLNGTVIASAELGRKGNYIDPICLRQISIKTEDFRR